jgi:uncharacterized MAPEG superfamily protein
MILDAYAPTVVVLALWGILTFVLSIVAVVGKPRASCACGQPARDYSDPTYRRHRAFQNALEATPFFLSATLAAIVIGAVPFWVNLLAVVFLIARLCTAGVHVGTTIQPLRSIFWTVGVICCLGLAGLAVVAALSA